MAKGYKFYKCELSFILNKTAFNKQILWKNRNNDISLNLHFYILCYEGMLYSNRKKVNLTLLLVRKRNDSGSLEKKKM